MGLLKSWRQREAEGDTSVFVKRARAAADAEARWEETGKLEDFHAYMNARDLMEMSWE